MSTSQLHTPTASQGLASGPRSISTLTPNLPAQKQRQMGRASSNDVGRLAQLAEPHTPLLEASNIPSGHALAGPATLVRVHRQGHCPSNPPHLGLAQAATQPLPTHAHDVQRPTFSPHGQQHQQDVSMPIQRQWLHGRSAMQQDKQRLNSSGPLQAQWQPPHQTVLQHMSAPGAVQPSSKALQHGSRTPQHGAGRLLHQQPSQQPPQQHTHAQSSAQHSSSAPQQLSSCGMPSCLSAYPQHLPHQLPLHSGHAGESAWHGRSTPESGGQRETQSSSKVLHQQPHVLQARPQLPAQHVSSISVGAPTESAPQSLRVLGQSDQPQPCSAAAAGPRRQQRSFHVERPAAPPHHDHASAQQGAAPLQHRSSDAATGPQRPAVPNLGLSGRHGAQQQSSLGKQSFRPTPAQPAASGPTTGPSEPSSSTGKPIEAARSLVGRQLGTGHAVDLPDPGHEHAICSRGPFKGTLMPDVLRAWVITDLAAHAAHLRRTSEASPTHLQSPSKSRLAVR